MGFDERWQLVGDIVVHLVMGVPRTLGGVEIETSAHAQIVGRIIRHALAARAGIRCDDSNAKFGGYALGSGFLHEVFIAAGQAREPVEHGYWVTLYGLRR